MYFEAFFSTLSVNVTPPPGVYLFEIQKSCFQLHSLASMLVVGTVEGTQVQLINTHKWVGNNNYNKS